MMALVPVLAASGQVNWSLLGLAGGILLVGGLGLVLFFRSRTGHEKPARRPSGVRHTHTPRSTHAEQPKTKVELRKEYDRAFSTRDFHAAARAAKQLQDNRLYAQAIENTGDLERAIQAWTECKEYERVATLLEKANRPVKAGQMYLQAGKRKRAALCFEKGGDIKRAAESYRLLGDQRKANDLEIKLLIHRGDHLEAAKRLIQNDDMKGAAEQLLQGGEVLKAVEAFRRGGYPKRAAELLHKEGDLAAAALLFEEAEAWVEAAGCYETLEQTADYERCLIKAGQGYDAGRVAYERGDLEQALLLFESISPMDERYLDAGLFRGQIFERLGKLQEAADAYNLFLRDRLIDANNRILVMRVAQILEGIGRPRAALHALARMLTAGFGTPDITAWASRLEDAAFTEGETEVMAAELHEDRVTSVLKNGSIGGVEKIVPSSLPHMNERIEGRAVDALSARYRFGECMGQGGNGIVYRATDLALSRDVVVKFLHQGLLPTDVARKYFMREARTAAKLNHPNIVTIFDIGEEENMLFYSMELVDGQTLADLIINAGGRLSHSQILPIARSLCDALQYAHDQQVIHRDIKPGNVMVDEKGQVKLLDFGLAKALDENPDKSVFLCGTPFYMSPEQICRDFLDHRTDIYSLGCLLYVMYTGDVPFPDGNVFQHHQQSEVPDPRTRISDIPPHVAETLVKALAKDRNDRFQQAEMVAFSLSSVD